MTTQSIPAGAARGLLPTRAKRAAKARVATQKWQWARLPVALLGLLSGALFSGSFFLPWWRFWLYAPQYPKGLRLEISLTGMGGDVAEIDLLNHYIGMGRLADAATFERTYAAYGVALLVVATLLLVAFAGPRLNKVIAIVALAFPVAFIADSNYWLHRFGHDLDPRAPLEIAPFTPQMFGNGQIGQFETFAQPALGFWLCIAGVACAVLAAVLRSKVTASCARAWFCPLLWRSDRRTA
jgi:copper chaperone NosL